MNRFSARFLIPLLLAVFGLTAGCSDAGLVKVPPPAPPVFDNLLTVKGQYCTEPAEEIDFPIKILFLLDQSSSLQCTDQYLKRFDALNATINDLSANPNVYFGFVGFSARLELLPFTADINQVQSFVSVAQNGAGPATDYQGALATAIRMLEEDMVAVGPATRARTRYVVVFMSDGSAEPRCNLGCEDDTDNCSDGEDNDGDGLVDGADQSCDNINDNVLHPDNLYGVCNFQGEILEGDYVDMQGLCPEYNQPPQILQRVSQIIELKSIYSVGDVTLNSVLLFNTEEVTDSRCIDVSLFGYNKEQAENLLQAMATTGNGTFRDVNLEYDDDTFLEFNFTSLASEQWLTSFLATNLNAREVGGIQLDSDRDGVPDSVENAMGMDYATRDSDGDGYMDLVEYRYNGKGFDPMDPQLPAITCSDDRDFDGEVLKNCEEALVGTEDRVLDTDLDGIPDWHEIAAGTDPTVDDQFDDLDFDGIPNGEEIKAGTDPLVPDEDTFRTERMRYGLVDLGEVDVPRPVGTNGSDVRHCYEFTVEDIRMVTPLYNKERGRNRITFHALERPVQLSASQTKGYVACVEAYYNGESDKFPESGVLDISETFWQEQTDLLAIRLNAVALCRGIPLADMRRGDVIETSGQCLPWKVVIGDTVFERADMEDLVRKYVTGGLATTFPRHPSHLWVPIEDFDEDEDCLRLVELQRMRDFLELLATECEACYAPPEEIPGEVAP